MAKNVTVRLLVSMCGAVTKDAGDEHRCSEAEARRLIAAGVAEAIPGELERAVKSVPATREVAAVATRAGGAVSRAAAKVKQAITGGKPAE